MDVEGQGGTAAATAQGAAGAGKIDNAAQAEAPVQAAGTASAPQPANKPNATAKIGAEPAAQTGAAPPSVGAVAVAATGAGLIQLGAYGSQVSAEQGWTELKDHFTFLAPMAKSIVAANVGGATVYRLRASAGDAAAATCAKLKAGGANCIIAH